MRVPTENARGIRNATNQIAASPCLTQGVKIIESAITMAMNATAVDAITSCLRLPARTELSGSLCHICSMRNRSSGLTLT